MHHIEAVEPRHLLAATLRGDPSFGAGGGVALAKGFGIEVLATHEAVYVEHFNARRGTVYLSKYTDAGVLDTSWGDGGSVRPTLTRRLYAKDATAPQQDFALNPVPPAKLVYDVRTGGVLLSIDGGRTLSIERFTADGHDDALWGTSGVVQYTTAKGTTLTLGKLLPTAGKKLAVAFTTVEHYGTEKGTLAGTDTGMFEQQSDGTAVLLARFDRFGHADKSFNGGRPVVVRQGHVRDRLEGGNLGTDSEVSTDHSDTDASTVSDLLSTYNGYRLIAVRERTDVTSSSDLGTDRFRVEGGFTKWSVDSIDVTTRGRVAAPVSAAVFAQDYDQTAGPLNAFKPLLAVADDGLVEVLAVVRGLHRATVQRIRVSSGRAISDTRVRALDGDQIATSDVVRNADGVTFAQAEDGPGTGRVIRFTRDLEFDADYGDGGAAIGLTSSTDSVHDLLNASDDIGRFVSLDRTAGGALTLRRLVT